MHWRTRILAASLLSATCGATGAQNVGRPAPELHFINDSFSIEQNNGKILVLVFWRTDDKKSIDAIPILNGIHRRLGNKGVVVMSITAQEKEAVEQVQKDHEIRFRAAWGGLTHQTYAVSSFPRIFLIDTLGTVVWKGDPSDDLEARIREQLIRTPTAGSDTALLVKKLSKAKRFARTGDLGRAFLLADNVAEVAAADSAAAKNAEQLKSALETSAEKRLERVRDALRASDFEKAGELAAMLRVYFNSTDVGRSAKQEIDRIRADAKGKDAFNKAVKAGRAVRQTDRAAAMEQSKQYERASQAYRDVTDQFPETEAARTALKAIERIKRDPAIKRHLKSVRAERQAGRWLDIGERFDRLDMREQAREYYQKVVTTHPDSRAAERARRKLKG